MFSLSQLMYVAEYANKKGAKGLQLKAIIPPTGATQHELDFKFVFEVPKPRSASEKDWRD